MSVSTRNIFTFCRAEFDETVDICRDLHVHPEIGFDVHRTAGIAATGLKKLELKVTAGMGKSGVCVIWMLPAPSAAWPPGST